MAGQKKGEKMISIRADQHEKIMQWAKSEKRTLRAIIDRMIEVYDAKDRN